jgi:hypothetical protein
MTKVKHLINTKTGAVFPFTDLLASHEDMREASQEEVDAYFAEQAGGVIKNKPRQGTGSLEGETVSSGTAPVALNEDGTPVVVPAVTEIPPQVAAAIKQRDGKPLTAAERKLLKKATATKKQPVKRVATG